MLIYIFIFLILIFFMLVNELAIENNTSIELFTFKLSYLILTFFMACRSYMIGMDTKEYFAAFNQIKGIPIQYLNNTPIFGFNGNYILRLEIGYKYLNKLIGCVSTNSQTIIIFTSIIITLLTFYLIKKYSPNILLSVWLYFTFGIYQTQMNISRNSLAILISYCAIGKIKEKKFVQYCMIIFFGSLFHSSVLVLIPLYFVCNRLEFSTSNFKFTLTITILLGVVLAFSNSIISHFLPDKYNYLAENGSERIQGMFVGIIYLIIFFLIWFYIRKYSNTDFIINNSFGNWMFLISILCYVSSFGLTFTTRLAVIFATYMIVYFPRLINNSGLSKNRKKILSALVVILCGLIYLARIGVNNIGGTSPYIFFWN